MQIMFETLRTAESEIDALVKSYFADTNAQDSQPPLQMVWPFYRNLEDKDRLVIVGAREGAELVGFVMYAIMDHPHHGGMKFALCDILAVATKHRGRGVGKTLVEAAEVYFRTTDRAEAIIHAFRVIYDTEPLFPKLGFQLIEKQYIKVL
jgi:predicted N-acetyltransferase YhbS